MYKYTHRVSQTLAWACTGTMLGLCAVWLGSKVLQWPGAVR